APETRDDGWRMRSHVVAAAALILSSAIGAFAESPTASAALRLAPPIVLPGLPSAFVLTIKNTSGQPLRLFDGVVVNVSGGSGTFEAKGVNDRTQFELPES